MLSNFPWIPRKNMSKKKEEDKKEQKKNAPVENNTKE